jgi:predicted GIY-YIG superfamily endonuclease
MQGVCTVRRALIAAAAATVTPVATTATTAAIPTPTAATSTRCHLTAPRHTMVHTQASTLVAERPSTRVHTQASTRLHTAECTWSSRKPQGTGCGQSGVMYVYALVNHQGMTYVGVSRHPIKRLVTHNSKAKSLARHYTNRHRPWKMAAVVQGFTTKKQALRAEYMIKHQPVAASRGSGACPSAIVARVALVVRTCGRLLANDSAFERVSRVLVVIWDQRQCTAVDQLAGSVHSVCTVYKGCCEEYRCVRFGVHCLVLVVG